MHNSDNNKDSVTGHPTICILGASLDVGNMGCRALTVSLIKLFTDINPDARIVLVYGNHSPSRKSVRIGERNIDVEVVNHRLSPRANLSEHLFWILLLAFFHRIIPPLRPVIEKRNKVIRSLANAAFVGDIRGGDSFSDIYGFARLFFGTIPIVITVLLRKKLVLLPQTYGPYRSKLSRMIARFTINAAHKVFSRDRKSVEVISELGINKEIVFCPDVAFTLEPVKPDWYGNGYNRNGNPLIGFNISGLLFNGGYNRNNMFGLRFEYRDLPVKLIVEFLTKTDAEILLIPHVFSSGVESDVAAAKSVYDEIPEDLRSRVHMMDHFADQSEIKYVIGKCDFFIGSRMHACIAALSQGIPAVGIAYSDKFKGVFESVGFGDKVVDAREKGTDEILSQIICFLIEIEDDKNKLMIRTEKLKSEFELFFEIII